MGHPLPRPKHLAARLLQIRRDLGISQTDLVMRLGVEGEIHVSKYENDVLEPPLPILLAHARLTDIPVENLIDDKLELPENDFAPRRLAVVRNGGRKAQIPAFWFLELPRAIQSSREGVSARTGITS